ncbi:DNA repair protein RecN (Recombination protein N) [Reichenbachiella faecimaris]|uniref:DNA repair protein RecN n=1 Tax=Reichenbachiella faecimaris TaxID=692418 RepID=A0A1W2GN94_REIFA|nr:DNA repair protein RecN [Reichenbachiella faecimaris]SMD38140.1 DNA repair protein RecN (Recombination protein N) [Reichenbachiella faecimaris]
MISSLSITNYALIKKLQLEPDAGLNIITGETGAGKSIMLGAVGLLLGNRADTKALLDKDKKCVVEGEFDISKLGLQALFEEEDLDYESSSIIRREINSKGKSRAFINDVPVTLEVMKTVGLRLIDIHSQNESIQLGNKSVKVKLIDDFAQTAKELQQFQSDYIAFTQLSKKLADLLEEEKNSKTDEDYKKYLLDELVAAHLKASEQAELEEELKLLEHAEEIKLKLSQISVEFDESDVAINDRLKEAASALKNISGFSKELETLSSRFESATEEIVDIVRDIVNIQENVEHNPARLEEVSQRLDLIYKLQQKHKVADVEGLVKIQTQLERETIGAINLEEEIKELKAESERLKKQLIKSAELLSEKRRSVIDTFSISLNGLLAEVGMPDGHVAFVYKRVEPWKLGIDEIEILFSANKGIKPEPVGNVASGGEFSRLMFCIKYLLASKTAMPTVVFDEIDTGVSGEIALKMANMMRRMSTNHQIISISHLPQIAARGQAHYFVYKNNEAEKAESMIRKLEPADRLEEIAKMIGGENPSDTARNSAKELIEME